MATSLIAMVQQHRSVTETGDSLKLERPIVEKAGSKQLTITCNISITIEKGFLALRLIMYTNNVLYSSDFISHQGMY